MTDQTDGEQPTAEDAERAATPRPTSGTRAGTSIGARPVPPSAQPVRGKFVSGSLRRHILIMTGTSAFGLMAIFIGDLANIFFLSMLDDTRLLAAIGYASSIVFVMISVGIGLAIGAAALISPALGRGDRALARRYAIHAILLAASVSAIIALVVWFFATDLLTALGATGDTRDLALIYTNILLLAAPMLAVGMTCASILRSVGDATRAMYVTLIGAIVTVALDPILIFGLDLSLTGAAIASFFGRVAVMLTGLYGVIRIHDLAGKPDVEQMSADAARLANVAAPAIATNLATPFGNAFITATIASYGDPAVAGWAIIGRVQPVAFGAIYALSGAIGPIIGQNYGAGEGARMREAYIEGLRITAVFTASAWVLLALLAGTIAGAFSADGETADLIYLFCYALAPLFVFLGMLFVTNAALNTLGRPTASTVLNWGRATLGTIPFVWLGGTIGGASGVLLGWMLGGIAFGLIGVWYCLRYIADLRDRMAADTTA